MKKTLFTLALAAMSGVAVAQLPNYGVAPDFTITDVNGNSHNLYDILDEGKPVVIDLFAEWCGPCWSYHQSGNLENLYTQYGPDGSDELMVWGVESDDSTPLTAIDGGTGSTNGWNWLTGIQYPMANDNNIANIFNLSYFPTVVTVCPDRSVTESGQRTTASHYAVASACPDLPTQSTDRALKEYTGDLIACGGNPISMKVILWNQGTTDALTTATIKVMDGTTEVSSTPWTGNLAPYAATQVNLGMTAIGAGDYTIVISETDGNASNNSLDITVVDPPLASLNCTVEVTTDAYPGETSWEITDENGTVVASAQYQAGPGQAGSGGPDASTTHSHPVTLQANKCYTVTLEDSYGDGMAYYLQGEQPLDWGIKLLSSWGTVIVEKDGDFEDATSAPAKTDGTSGIEEQEMVTGLSIYPNPAVETAMVSFVTLEEGNVELEMFNALGAKVYAKNFGTKSSGNHLLPLSLDGLSSGIYVINVVVNDAVYTQRLSVEK